MADSGTYTPETIARRIEIAKSLLGDPKQPVRHWAEGLNELAKGYFGGKMFADAENAEKTNNSDLSKAYLSALGIGSPAAPSADAAPPPANSAATPSPSFVSSNPQPTTSGPTASQDYGKVIAGIESGGKYDAIGPVTKTGDRAYGRYQVMGANIPSWTKEAIGVEMTPQQFAASPEAQDAVFKKKFGSYVDKYGPEGAARAWFAGEGGMNNPNAKDILGTTVSSYADKFRNGLGPQPIPNVITPPQAVPIPNAAPEEKPVVMTGSPSGRVVQALSQPPVPSPTPMQGGNTRSAIVQMLNSPNPAVQKMGRTLAAGLIQKQFTEDVPTNDMKEYQAAVRQGFKGTLLEYQTKLKEAGKPVTNINQQQESEYEKAMGKQFADANMEIIKSAGSARGKIATLDRLNTLLKDPSIYTGAGGQGVLELKRLGKAIGIDVGDVGPAEAAKSISNQFALELRNPSGGAGMPGAMSDKDREFLQSMVPGLGQNPQGNALIIDYMKRVAQRSVDVERLRQAYVRKHGRLNEGFYSELADWSDAHPLFTEDDMKKAAVPAPAAGAPTGASIDDLLRKYGGK